MSFIKQEYVVGAEANHQIDMGEIPQNCRMMIKVSGDFGTMTAQVGHMATQQDGTQIFAPFCEENGTAIPAHTTEFTQVVSAGANKVWINIAGADGATDVVLTSEAAW
ncbi:hypothetical protein VCHA38O209_50268 [Vibrio chagasii]|nr:hypothetical protein VCHA38O209_50268 [Vibrio chagasii]